MICNIGNIWVINTKFTGRADHVKLNKDKLNWNWNSVTDNWPKIYQRFVITNFIKS